MNALVDMIPYRLAYTREKPEWAKKLTYFIKAYMQ